MPLRKLTPEVQEKVWGTPLTEPWAANPQGLRIGEICFSAPDSFPILVKFLFTSDRMSIQVHPPDAYAQKHGGARGKTEMWHVLRAESGATVAVGLRETASAERVREAAENGEIVGLLNWETARTGDTFFIPAGTIHAIGGGLVLCEIQQLSDLTYRLYDYQRTPARPLHLDDALAVSSLDPCDCRRSGDVVECEYFRSEKISVEGKQDVPAASHPVIYVAVAGEGQINGKPFHAGEAWLADAGMPPFAIESPDALFVLVRQP